VFGQLASPSVQGDDIPLEVHQITLTNGMRVLVLPRPGAPTISFVMQFGIGGVNEAPGSTGIAHLLEHMLFKGSTTIGTRDVAAERELFRQMDLAHAAQLSAIGSGDSVQARAHQDAISALEDEARELVIPNEYTSIITRAGGQGLNAMTTSEATTYFVELPANRMELFFALESDRMANPVFREFYRERDVVMEERRMRVDTSPGGSLYEAHLREAFQAHPYGQPVVGTMDDLFRLTRSDVSDYYRRFYGPGNSVLAIVGQADVSEVEALAVRYFGPIAEGEQPPAVAVVEPPQTAERRIHVEWDAQPLLRIGWHIPAVDHEDAAPLALLSSILTGGRTSRLHRRLVTEERVATSIFSSTGPGSLYPGLFQIDATPVHPATPAQLEARIYEEIERISNEGPTAVEVDRVINQIEAGSIRRLQSNLGLAFQLADSESLFDDWRETFRSPRRFTAVRPEDVQRVAAKYLTPTNRTVGTLGRLETAR
jgi:predicted Zn-dependent peptidase